MSWRDNDNSDHKVLSAQINAHLWFSVDPGPRHIFKEIGRGTKYKEYCDVFTVYGY